MARASYLTRRSVLLGGAAALSAPAILPSIARAVAPVDAGTAARINERVGQYLAAFGAPGVSLAFGRNGGLDFAEAYGVADLATGEPLRAGHRFRIASISKPITAAAIMLLVEHGRIGLQQPVFGAGGPLANWIPIDGSFPQADWLRAITIDHLLTHTAGGWTNDGLDPMFRNSQLGHADLVRATLREAPLRTPPGSTYAYSNFGYCLLGRIIEAAGEEGYQQFVRRRLLQPAGAGSMEIGGNGATDRRSGEVAYAGQGGDSPYGFNLARMDSHGGWIGTPTDLVRVAQRINGDDPVPDLLGPQSIAMMRAASAASQAYGRGWAISSNHQNRWHAGALPGLVSVLVLQAGGTAFAGLVNTRTIDGRDAVAGLDTLLWDVHGALYG